MANTYKRIYIQIVFAVKNRRALLHKSWRKQVFKYIGGCIKKRGHYPLAINGVEDHIHIFLDFKGDELISDLVREIKKASNYFIKENGFCDSKFEWQSGYGVFSHSAKEKGSVINYIQDQERRHLKIPFKNEYLTILESNDVEYQDQYLFSFLKIE